MTPSDFRALAERTFAAVMAKDLDASLALFADDAVFFDPHYPVREMRGKAAIEDGLRWGFAGMESFGFDIQGCFTDEDGTRGAVEVWTHHVLKGGQPLEFQQAFMVDTRDGLITRLRAYEPYGPEGVVGLVVAVQGWLHRTLPKPVAKRPSRA